MRIVARNPSRPVDGLAAVTDAVHDLCQPLTSLLCRLEVEPPDEEGGIWMSARMHGDCLRECRRMEAAVAMIRAAVARAQAGQGRIR